MARAIEQIERELAALLATVSAIAAELGNAYTNYFKALGQATRAQLILASYQICTQGYAKQFLSLSFSQRQQLQQAIRKLGQNAADQLLSLVKTEEKDIRNQESEDKSQESIEELGARSQESEERIIYNSSFIIHPYLSSSLLDQRSSNPIELAQWQQNLEEAIAYTLTTLSLETNRLLQQAGILPQKLPASLLEVATTASETATEIAGGPPNLLNLLIETENSPESEDSKVTQLIAIQLRLPEIEFADVNVRATRNQIRQLEARLNSLKREYQKKQRERMIAEAEAAWRSSWFDE
jgi:thiaminase